MKKIVQLFIILLFLPLAICKAEELPYDRFVGLGNHCVTRSQIDFHLMERFGLDKHSFGGGQLFDWLVIHNYRKLAEAIENDCIDLFDRSDLTLVSWNDVYRCVKNVKYDMTWNHLFTRNPDTSIQDNIIELEYELRKEKIDYLTNKFKNLSCYRTLYIISYNYEGALLGQEPTADDLLHLKMALLKLRGNDNFNILYCPYIKKCDDFDQIFVREIPHFGGDNGLLNPLWNSSLSQFPFKLDPKIVPIDDNIGY